MKVKCEKVIMSGVLPSAVLVASDRKHGKFVLVPQSESREIERLLFPGEREDFYQSRAISPYKLDVETDECDVGEIRTLNYWRGIESAWISVSEAPMLLHAFRRWQMNNTPRPNAIRAPDHRTLTAFRRFAIAAGLEDPGPEGRVRDGWRESQVSEGAEV